MGTSDFGVYGKADSASPFNLADFNSLQQQCKGGRIDGH